MTARASRAYRALLRLYPREFRQRFADDMADLFDDQLAAARARGRWAPVALWLRVVTSLVHTSLLEHRDAILDRPALSPVVSPRRHRPDPMLTSLSHDVRLALRMLGKSPVFTVVAVLVISLGTGAVTTIYSALDALVLRPLPAVSDPGRVVGFEMLRANGNRQMTVERSLVRQLQARTSTLADVATWNRNSVTVFPGREGIAARGIIVSGNYFRVLGVTPATGRFFRAEEDSTPLTHPVVVLSHAFWQDRLGGDPAVVGRVLKVNGSSFTVIGITPPGFAGAMPIVPPDVYVPFAMEGALSADGRDPNRPVWVRPVARLRDGASVVAAERELTALVRERAADPAEPVYNRDWSGVRLPVLRAVPEDARGPFLGFMSVLMAAAALVMLIASVNVASMLSARAIARRKEMAVRAALGAGRARLLRQLLTESVVLFGLGSAGGLAIAVATTRWVESLRLPVDGAPQLEVSPDPRAFVFALGVTVLTGLLFGLAPALQASRLDVTSRLRDDSSGGGTRRSRMANLLIAGQLAASLVLLVSAGLFIRAVSHGASVDPGFESDGVSTMTLNPESWGYSDAKSRAFYTALRERVSQLPGVEATSYTSLIPMSLSSTGSTIVIDGRDDRPANGAPEGVDVRLAQVGAGYFDVVRQPLVAGRGIADADRAGAAPVAVVNEAFVRRFLPGGAVGATFREGDRRYTIVGVARDAHYESVDEVTPPVVYYAIDQRWSSVQVLMVRSTMPPSALAGALQQAVLAQDGALPRPMVVTLRRANEVALLPQRIGAMATGLLGGLGLLLAAVGLYGVMAYSVGRRTREIGVRVALGANRGAIVRLVVGEGMRVTLAGAAVGIALSLGASRILSRFLLGLDPLDALAFGLAPMVFLGVTALASWLPARRAAGTDPMRALRTD